MRSATIVLEIRVEGPLSSRASIVDIQDAFEFKLEDIADFDVFLDEGRWTVSNVQVTDVVPEKWHHFIGIGKYKTKGRSQS